MSIHRVGNSMDVTTPAWLYELLPVIYIIAGVGVAASISGLLAVLSSALLIVAGVQVFRMRGRHRRSMRHPQRVQIRSRS